MSEVPKRLSAALLTALVALCIYRARIQSFTVDESWVFNLFVSQKLAVMGQTYDACNHVLHTLLMKLSRGMLGNGEFALRVPGLIGAAIYFTGVYKLTRLVLGGWTQLLAVALLTLHPLVLDFMVAARGYGLALGLFTFALYCAIVYHVKGFERKWMRRAGVLAGLSIAANLVMIVPAAALGFTLLVLSWRNGAWASWSAVDNYGGPAVVTAFLILVVPLLPAKQENFYFGEDSLAGFALSLVSSAVKVPDRWPARFIDAWGPAIANVILPVFIVALGVAAVLGAVRFIRSQQGVPYRTAPFLIVSGTLSGSVFAILLLHLISGVKYPMGRTGLYLLPLFFLAGLLWVRLPANASRRSLRVATNFAGAALVLVFVAQTDNRYFQDWLYDAGTGRLLRTMHEDFAQRVQPGQDPVRLGTSLFVNETVNYYRTRRRLDWLATPEAGKADSGQYDYYLLYGKDTDLVAKLKLNVIAQDPVSGELLARRAE